MILRSLLFLVAVISVAQSGFAQDTWSTKGSMTVARSYTAGGVINGKLYVVGGTAAAGGSTNSLEVYDPATNTWSSLASMPTSRAYLTVTVHNNKLYAIGGCIGSDCIPGITGTLEVYDPATNTWSTKAPMPTARTAVAAGAIANKIYVAGGMQQCGPCTPLSLLEIYDVTTNTWTTGASMPAAANRVQGAVINGKFYVVGGNNNVTAVNSLYEYDPIANTWATKAALPTARYDLGVGVINNKLFAATGYGASSITGVLEVYDPATNVWSSQASIPTPRTGVAAAAIGSVLYVVAGTLSATLATSTTVEAFSSGIPPTIQTFSPTSGPVGSTVTITGTNFSTTAANNIVYFGATRAFISAATATQLTVIVPSGATYQPVTVTVNGLTAYSLKPFALTFPSSFIIDQNSFAAKVDVTVGTTNYNNQICVGDLDGDSKPDLAIADQLGNAVSALKNTSSGTITFTPYVSFTTGSNPQGLNVADLDGDGKLDIVSINYVGNTISTFRNISATGTLSASSFGTKVDLLTGTNPVFCAIGDLNGDGKPDLAVTNGTSNSVSIFKNTSTLGTISFEVKSDYITGTAPRYVAVGDIDGDGKLDLAIANYNSASFSVLRNTSLATLTFATRIDVSTGTGTSPLGLALGDLDDDGKTDVIVTNDAGATVSVFKNNSVTGSITFAPQLNLTAGTRPYSVTVGDLDGDTKPDLAVASNTIHAVSIFKNYSTSGTVSFGSKVDFTTGLNPTSIVIADLNGDGKPDLAVSNSFNPTVSIFQNTMTASSAPAITNFTPGSGVVGTIVTITGNNFDATAANNIVKFNGTTATVTSSTTTSITTTVPAGAISGAISVTVGTLTATSLTSFTVTTSTPAPTISGFNPASGVVGTTVTISGTNFDATAANNMVKFNGTTATVTSSTATSIATTVPAGATTGAITVTVGGQTATSTTNFTVTTSTPAPTISGFNPTSGVVGTIVTISGTNFDATAANNMVKFNGTTATVTSSTTTTITATVPAGATTGTITVTVGGQTATSATTFTLNATPDSTPPTITDKSPVTVNVGTGLSITATITDSESAITSASVEYRSISKGGATTTSAMTLTGPDYSITILASEIGELGIEYKISATSSGGTATTGTTFKTVKINFPATSNGLTIPYTSFGNTVSHYRIVAVPLELTSKTVTGVFEELGPYNKERWRMYRYDNGSTNELSGNTQMLPGQGFWLIIKDNPGNAINSGGGNSVNASSSAALEIDLKADWNQIGNPYNFNLSWADVQAANPGLPGLRIYNGNFADGTRLDKMQGGFVKVTTAQKLKFPVVKNASVNGRMKKDEVPFQNELTHPDWQVVLHVQQGELTNQISGFGMNQKASEQFDVFDGFNMPSFFKTYLQLSHNKKEGSDFYSKDIVPTSDQYVWEFFVGSSSNERLMKFNWDNSFFGQNEKELYLWDVSLQRGIDMRSTNVYAFDKTLSKSFRIVFGPKDFVKEQTVVQELVLHAVWPNPAVGDVTISFSLPESTSSQPLDISIIDLLGRKQWSHQSDFAAGYQEMTWHRPKEEAKGIYFIQLQSGAITKKARLVLK